LPEKKLQSDRPLDVVERSFESAWNCVEYQKLMIALRNSIVCILISLIAAGPSLGQGFAHTVLVHSGMQAPGTSPGVTFTSISLPATSDQGGVSVPSSLVGPGVNGSNDFGTWFVDPSGSIEKIYRFGDVAPGTGGAIFSLQAGFANIGADGTIAHRSGLSGAGVTTTNNKGIWAGTAGNMLLHARTGTVAPGTGGALFSTFGNHDAEFVWVTPSGHVVFNGKLVQGGSVTAANDNGTWVGPPGSSVILLREGDVAPGTGGAVFSEFQPETYHGTNNAGVHVIKRDLIGPGVNGANNSGIWRGVPGNLELVMRQGDVVPGTGRATWAFLSNAMILGDNRVGFFSQLAGAGVNDTNNQGIWVGNNSADMQVVLRKGDALPGLPVGVTALPNLPRGNENHLVFRAGLQGTGVTASNDQAFVLWSATAGLQVIMREGDVAPGTGGATFVYTPQFPTAQSSTIPAVSESGFVAFCADLTGAGVTTANNAGIWVWDGSLLHMIMRKGDVIDLDPGSGTDLATVSSFNVWEEVYRGTRSGFGSFDANNRLVWHVGFTDGRFAAVMTAIPEPTTIAMIGVTALLGRYAAVRARSRNSDGDPTVAIGEIE
jgi:hypothetical protein